MNARQKRRLEQKLIQALQSRFGDPESEAPMTLRDQPNEIVYTALQPRRVAPERSGVMGFGQMPSLPSSSGMDDWSDPMTSGQATMQAMLGSGSPAPQAAAPTVDVQANPQTAPAPAPAPQQAAAQPSEEEMMQKLLVGG